MSLEPSIGLGEGESGEVLEIGQARFDMAMAGYALHSEGNGKPLKSFR